MPRYGPVFKALGKPTFGFYDKPPAPFQPDAVAKLDQYTKHWESPHKGIENVLAEEIPSATLRNFLEAVKDRADYPAQHPKPAAAMSDDEIKELARKVLKDRKGEAHGYAALLQKIITPPAAAPAAEAEPAEAAVAVAPAAAAGKDGA